jgi:bleomycin hydrolase
MLKNGFFVILSMILIVNLFAEDDGCDSTDFKYEFITKFEVKSTEVKDQGRSGTCWAFGTVSFLESEIFRETGREVNLSEMFIVRGTYADKARKYVRLHGANNFSQGGQCHDVTDQIRQAGIVPQSVYPDFVVEEKIDHGELSNVLTNMLEGILDSRYLTEKWYPAVNAVLDVYLGEMPKKFIWEEKEYTPQSFTQDYLKLNPDDYIEITSYSNYPFYETCCLEVPDNWSYNCDYYNVPIDELVEIVENGIKKGYSICWDADVSEEYFTPDTFDIALLPTKAFEDTIEDQWDGKIKGYVDEMVVDQAMRQETFDNFRTTDDHLMHLVGIAEDQRGNKFYKIKNSWGTEDRQYDGYYYISEAYFRLKTVALMINKKALSVATKGKLKLNLMGKILH